MAEENFSIERVMKANAEVAKGIGQLMPDLSERLQNKPIDADLLDSIIESPDRDLFLARVNGRIVGSAVMNLITFTSGKKA